MKQPISFLSPLLTLSLALSPALLPSTARADWGPFETGELTLKEILADSSTPALKPQAARVITDNDAAFASKIDAIRGAKKSLRLVYYIFSDDHSSSVFSEELINAAHRGVQVRLLLDYHTNYKHLDLLSALEREGAKSSRGGSIEVRLFNRPSREIMKDAYFLTSDCSPSAKKGATTDCSKDKLAATERFFNSERDTRGGKISNLSNTFMSLFLSGLYSKNGAALQAAVFEGGNLDLAALKEGAGESTPAEVQQLKDFGRLLFDAKFKGSLEAKIKLALAFAMYGDDLDPVYRALSTTLPLERERNEAAKKDWKHLTDFTHHKLLVADDTVIQLGGRNIEDSYHTQPSPLTAKYTFMDTDMWVRLKTPESSIGRTFDRLFGFNDMVATLAEVRRHAPNDMVKNLDQFKMAAGSCQAVKKSSFHDYDACVGNAFEHLNTKSIDARMDQAMEAMRKNANIYRTQYKPTPLTVSDELSASDVNSMLLTYIENVPFDRSDRLGQEARTYGSLEGQDTRHGKSIHSLWVQALRNTCKTSYESGQRTNVILHQGYVLLPGNMMLALNSMLNGEWDCRNVDILILTNSVHTTDLNIINFFARYQLKALVERVRQSGALGKPRIKVLEYSKQENGPVLSLHTKVSLFGNDVIVGSANADVRSYYMDTNNGFFFRGAKNFVRDYTAFVAKIATDSSRVQDVTKSLLTTSPATMISQDIAAITTLIKSKDKKGHLTPQREKMIADLIAKIQTHVYDSSRKLLDISWIDAKSTVGESANNGTADKKRQQIEISDDFNALMMML